MRKLFFILTLLCNQLYAQYAPGIRNFTPKDYGRNQPPENYCILQDQRGLIYAGNAGGILQFNGTGWNFIPVQTGVHVTSMTIDSSGIIYVGTYNDFGYLSPDKKGALHFHSLKSLSDDKNDEPGLILKCHAVKDGIYFQAENGIYFYSKGNLLKIRSDNNTFHLSFSCNNEFYVRERQTGLKKYVNGEEFLISSDTVFTTYGIFGLVPFNDNTALVITKETGLWKLKFSNGEMTHFPLENISEIIPFFGGIRLSNSTFALNTFDRGILIISKEGKILSHIDKRSGLPLDEIKQISRDRQGNLWCVSSSGISFIEYNSPFEYYTSRHGLEGSVESILIHDQNIFAGTSSGFYLSSQETSTFFRKIPEAKGHIFEVIPVPGSDTSVIACSSEGLYLFRNGITSKLDEGIYNSAVYISSLKLIIATGAQGACAFSVPSFSKTFTVPFQAGRILRMVALADDGEKNVQTIWIGTLSNGVIRLKILTDGKILSDFFEETDGLISGYVRPFLLDKENVRPVFATTSGFQQFIPEEEIRKSLHDTLKGKPEFERGYFDAYPVFDSTWRQSVSAVVKKNSSWWFCVNDHILHVANSKRNNEKWFRNFDFGRINNFYQDVKNGKIYFCATDGLVSFDNDKSNGTGGEFPAYIHSVHSKSKKILFAGTYGDSTGTIQNQPVEMIPEVEFDENSVEFQFAYPYFETYSDIHFSWMLEGHDEQWSPWRKASHATYTNLYEGDYTFHVKAKSGSGTESSPASFSFTILSPWYRTGIAYFIYFIFGTIFILLIMRISSHQLKQKNIRLENIVNERTAEIAQKNTELVHQQKEITDSITYAKRIQEAILPVRKKINIAFPESFILYKPKDIVSGDFFWFHSDKEKSIIICADCTGHGVPGAFMSMICTDKLNHIILEQKIIQPSKILSELNKGIKKSLKQEDEENLQTKDGMDGAICMYDHTKKQLLYSGANRPLWLLRNGEWVEFRPTKSAIGGFTPEEKEFEEELITIKSGDQIYMSTDGYADQFGGEKGKKMMVKTFKNKITEIHSLPLKEQEKKLDQFFEFWKSHIDENGEPYEQIDDVCVIGVRF